MINALICTNKPGKVLQLSLPQLTECPYISRVLIADGPHIGPVPKGTGAQPGKGYGPFHDSPSVKDVVAEVNSKKVVHCYTDNLINRAYKNSHALKNVSSDCQWILCVDADEVYHEEDLVKLASFLNKKPKWDRYVMCTVDLYQDFEHQLLLKDSKPRLYRWFPGAKCPPSDRSHQFVLSPRQKKHPTKNWGAVKMDRDICQMYHLNAMRTKRRIRKMEDGNITIHIGGKNRTSKIHPFDIKEAPKTIREWKGSTEL